MTRRRHLKVVDEFSTETSYDEEIYYTAATDEQGHSAIVRFRVPPSLQGEISKIVQGGKVAAYTTMQDFYRDALFHRLQWIADRLGDVKLLGVIERERRLVNTESKKNEYEGLSNDVESTTDLCRKLSKAGDWELLKDTIDDVEVTAEGSREPYRGKLEALVAKYRAVLKSQSI